MANQTRNRELNNSTSSQRVSNINNTSPPDGNHVDAYMLKEARTLYKDQYPPFVSSCDGRRHYQGNRKVVVLATSNGRRPNANSAKKAEVACHAWDVRHVFWTLDLSESSFIVREKRAGHAHIGGTAYQIWRGPEEGFDEKKTAFSTRESHWKENSHVDDETEQPDEDSPPEPTDEDYESPVNQQSSTRKHHSRFAKDRGNARIKRLATVTAGPDRRLQEPRERQNPQALPKHKPRAQARPDTNNATGPSIPSLPTPQTGTSPSPPPSNPPPPKTTIKRQRSSSSRSPSRFSRPRPRTRSPSIIEIHPHPTHPSLDHYQQSHTTLHISQSTNDYGAVPIYLRSCMTVDSFFISALSAWGLEGKEDEVAAVAVRFDWLREEGAMVVRRGVGVGFEKMLERIAEAPVWGEGEREGRVGRRGCDVRVRIVMRDVPAAT